MIEDHIGNSTLADFGAGLGFYGWFFTRHYPKLFTKLSINDMLEDNFLKEMGSFLFQRQVIQSYHG